MTDCPAPSRTPCRARLRSQPRASAGLLLILFTLSAHAQQVFTPLPTIPEEQIIPPAPQAPTPTPAQPAPGATVPPINTARPVTRPLQWGPITLHPELNYHLLYATGVQSAPGQPQNTVLNQFSPGLGVDVGSHWTLNYTPTLSFYSDPAFQNHLDQSFLLAGATTYEEWTFKLTQSCALTSDPQVQTAQQTSQQDYITTLDNTYELNDVTSLDFGARQNLLYVQNLPGSVGNSLDWSGYGGLSYRFAPSLSAGAEAGAGYNAVQIGSDMTYEQIQARVAWKVAHKVDLSASGGAEFRQFLDSTEPQLISPISAVTLNYRPFRDTSFALNTSRTVSASYYQNVATATTSVNATILQGLFKRLALGVNANYVDSTYHATSGTGVANPFAGREDTLTSIGASLNTPFLKHGTASAYYTHSHNSSNQSGFSYTSNQIGFQLTYLY